MAKHIMALTYAPKIAAVKAGECCQTIRRYNNERPKALGRDMLRLDRQAFVSEYRRRYGIMPSAGEWLRWYDFDKRRLEEARHSSGVKARGERR